MMKRKHLLTMVVAALICIGPAVVPTSGDVVHTPAGVAEFLAINNGNVAVGRSGDQPVLWSTNTTNVLAPPTGYAFTLGYSINDANVLGGVTVSQSNPSEFRAVTWSNNTWEFLPDLGVPAAEARSINNIGQAAGVARTAAGQGMPVYWPGDGTAVPLGTFGTDSSGNTARDINNVGTIVGQLLAPAGEQFGRAVRFNPGGSPTNLHPLLVHPSLGAPDFSSAVAISDTNLVTGGLRYSGGQNRAYVLDLDGGSLPRILEPQSSVAFVRSFANDINDAGMVGGYISNATSSLDHAAVWLPDGSMIDVHDTYLAPLGFMESRVFGINDNGWIVGRADGGSGFIITPEPSALSLVALGSIAMLRRRR